MSENKIYVKKIEGVDNFRRITKGIEKEVTSDQFARLVFRKAAAPMLVKIKAGSPVQTGKTKRSPSIRNWKGPRVIVGFSTKGMTRRGKEMPDYMKAYWSAYGTLSNRDNTHRFLSPRKAKSRMWRGGIRARGFYEKAIASSVDQSNAIIEKLYEDKLVDTAKKYSLVS